MKCIDFDEQFSRYVRRWMESVVEEGLSMDEAEDMVPEVYERFLDTPAAWLNGVRPGEYFLAYDDPVYLIRWLEQYIRERVNLPDMLLNRIVELGSRAEAPLDALIRSDAAPLEEKMLAVTLLREIGSLLPLDVYVDWQAGRGLDDELCDNAVESLEEMGEAAVGPMLEALEGATDAGKEALLSALSRYPGDERVYQGLISLFDRCPDRQAILACYLSRLGDVRALDRLIARAADDRTGYLDYIELRSAIEALGGEAPGREFDADPGYDALFGTD